MTSIRIVFTLAGALLLSTGKANSESANCKVQLQQQDEQCQVLAEKLAEACPSGTQIKETAECRELSNEIARTCTRKPCAPPPRKGKRGRAKGMGMGRGMASPRKR